MSKEKKRKKPPLVQRVRDNVRALGDAGSEAVRNPRSIPGTAEGFFRRWFRKLWEVRGGGLYAVGYAATFIWLEVTTLLGEFFGMESIQAFVSEQFFEFIFRFASETIANMVKAFMWPVYFVQLYPPIGAIGLGLAFWLFPILIKPTLERWLFRDEV